MWGAGLQWRPLPAAEAPTEPTGETASSFVLCSAYPVYRHTRHGYILFAVPPSPFPERANAHAYPFINYNTKSIYNNNPLSIRADAHKTVMPQKAVFAHLVQAFLLGIQPSIPRRQKLQIYTNRIFLRCEAVFS